MKLVDIDSVRDDDLRALQKEFRKNKEILHGGNGLLHANNLEDWRRSIKILEKAPPKNKVRTKQFFMIDNIGNLVGVIDFRYKLLAYQELDGGHISYSVRKTYRNKGYSKLALEALLVFVKEASSLNKVLLTCLSKNKVSKKTIINCGGILDITTLLLNIIISIYKNNS